MIPEPRRAAVSAGELAYHDLGDPDAPPVVLVHGFPTSSHLWRREMVLLSSRMRVIAPDLLGYGGSDKPIGADLSPLAQSGYVRELLDRLDIERPAVVGHDLGGAVAQLLALDGGAGALVLLDPACFDAWPIEGVRLLQGATPVQESDGAFVEEIVRLSLDLGVAKAGRLDEATIQTFQGPWRSDPRAFFRAARGIDGVGLAGREADLTSLQIPVLIVWGEEDPYLPPELGDRLNELIPFSTLALLPGCSHFVTLDAPETVGPLIFEYLRYQYLGDRHGHAHQEAGPVPVFLGRPPERFLRPDPDGDGEEG